MGKIIVFDTVIPRLERPKRIRVYLPGGPAPETLRPVLFMHDGHNLFDPSTSAYGASWNVHVALDRLAATGVDVPVVVGIDCPSPKRFDEYSPWVNRHLGTFKPDLGLDVGGGEGDVYVDWIADRLLPDVASRFPVDPARVSMAGSSMGGFISLYAACRRPETFRAIGAFSPAVWFAETDLLAALSASFPIATDVYLDIGTDETSDAGNPAFPQIYLEGARAVAKLLRDRGVLRLLYVEEAGAPHHETAWERRFPRFAEWLVDHRR